MMMQAIEIYRARFKPSAQLQTPYVMLGVSVFAAQTDDQGQRLFTSLQQQFLNLIRGTPGQLAPPVDSMDGLWLAEERAHVERSLSCAMVGSRDTVHQGLREFIARTGADELMITAQIYDHQARLQSFEIAAELLR
jgi:alkanesulfonate monooxygenase SsuD/methylene tetrahydromethanopterin reductase-like flavin-dependent oxidoreductase (luciferase family)